MRHTINTTVVNTPTGTPGSTDGVMMLVCYGVASTAGTTPLVVDTAYLGSKLDDFVTGLGITIDYDYVNGLSVYQQVKEFYDNGNNDGAYLWLVVTVSTNAYATYCATTTFKNLIRGTVQSDPAMRVKMLGLCYKPPAAQQSTTDFPADVLAAIPIIQATQVSLFAEGFQFSAILDGFNQSSTATSTTIQTMATKNSYSVSLCNSGSKPNGVSSVGEALRRFSRITIGHGFGTVEDGPIPLPKSYLTNGAYTPILGTTILQGTNLTAAHSYMVILGPVTYNGSVYHFGETFTVILGTLGFTGTSTSVVDLATTGTVTVAHYYYVLAGPITYNSLTYITGEVFLAVAGQTTFTGGVVYEYFATDVTKLFGSDVNNYGDKQYMFIRPWFGQPGLYWNDAATCDLSTKPLSTQEFNRVANRLSADVLSFLTLLMGKAIPIDTKTGLAAMTFVTAKQQDFYDQYINPLIVSQDISDGNLVLVGTRNGVSSINWTYTLSINGNPITGSVTGQVKFV
jgi:hypothetical protein